MIKKFGILFLILMPITGYSQCDSKKIIYIDSLGNEIDSFKTNLIYTGKDTIQLEPLYDINFKHRKGTFYNPERIHSTSAKSIENSSGYCIMCKEINFKLINSIDINQDGVKELFLHREWYCGVTPPNSGPYGVGGESHQYSRYEVWDIKTKAQLFEVKNRQEIQIAVSVNVMQNHGYRFNVSIDKTGSFILSNLKGDIYDGITEMGTYKYFADLNLYKKEK